MWNFLAGTRLKDFRKRVSNNLPPKILDEWFFKWLPDTSNAFSDVFNISQKRILKVRMEFFIFPIVQQLFGHCRNNLSNLLFNSHDAFIFFIELAIFHSLMQDTIVNLYLLVQLPAHPWWSNIEPNLRSRFLSVNWIKYLSKKVDCLFLALSDQPFLVNYLFTKVCFK